MSEPNVQRSESEQIHDLLQDFEISEQLGVEAQEMQFFSLFPSLLTIRYASVTALMLRIHLVYEVEANHTQLGSNNAEKVCSKSLRGILRPIR